MREENEKEDSTINGTNRCSKQRGALPAGTVLKERYRLEEVLGRGGFGITYRAMDQNVQVEIAVKEYLAESEKDRQCAMREARIAASLYDMEGIVAVRDYFVEHGIAYIVMEYVHGISVKQFIAQHGRMSGTEVLERMKPLLASVEKIHEKGILHRDISADNIMITQDGKLKLIDFGAANFLDMGREEHTVLIKRGFAPVEQYRAEEKMGPWSDVYALCATMYFMITGMVPEDAMERWINDRITNLEEIYGTGLSTEQSAALMKGLAVHKEERYQDLRQLCRELYSQESVMREKLWFRTEELSHQILSGHTQTLWREAAEALRGREKGRKRLLGSASVCLCVFAVVAGLWFWLGSDWNRSEAGQTLHPLTKETAFADDNTEELTVPASENAITSSGTKRTRGTRTASPAEKTRATGDVPTDEGGRAAKKASSAENTVSPKTSASKKNAKKSAGHRKKSSVTGKKRIAAPVTAAPTERKHAGSDARKASPAQTKKPVTNASKPKTNTTGKKSDKNDEFEGNLDSLLQ